MSLLELPFSPVHSVPPTPSAERTSSEEERGHTRVKDLGLFTRIKLVLTAITPLVGGLSLSNEEQKLIEIPCQVQG